MSCHIRTTCPHTVGRRNGLKTQRVATRQPVLLINQYIKRRHTLSRNDTCRVTLWKACKKIAAVLAVRLRSPVKLPTFWKILPLPSPMYIYSSLPSLHEPQLWVTVFVKATLNTSEHKRVNQPEVPEFRLSISHEAGWKSTQRPAGALLYTV